jgi:hypothetical protein
MIYGPKENGTYWVEFKTDQGASLVPDFKKIHKAIL